MATDRKAVTTPKHNEGYMPPQAIELEASVLGACLIEQEVIEIIADIITQPEIFYSSPHQDTFRAIMELFDAGSTVNFMTVGEKMKSHGTLEQAGGNYFIMKLLENVATTAYIEEHARIIVEKWIKREIIKQAMVSQAEAYNDTTDSFDLLDEIAGFSMKITDQVIRKPYVPVSTPILSVLAETEKLMRHEIQYTGVPTGFRELNQITGGWQRKDLIILAARPSVGKTAFLLNLALNASSDHEKPTPVGIFSLEMSAEQLTQRLMCNHCDISLERIKNGNLSEEEFTQLAEKASELSNRSIHIDDTPAINLTELRAKARRMINRHGVGLIIIDYLQLMSGNGRIGNREQEVSQISKGLKQMAKQLDVPIIALSQLSRMVEGRSDNTPKLSDLRESGSIEQDADLVMFLYGHPKAFLEKHGYRRNEKMLDIAKHRNGKLAHYIAQFNGDKQRFENMDMQMLDVQYTETSSKQEWAVGKTDLPPTYSGNLIPLKEAQGPIQDEMPF